MIMKVGAKADIPIVIAYDEMTSVGELLAEIYISGDHLGTQAHDQQTFLILLSDYWRLFVALEVVH